MRKIILASSVAKLIGGLLDLPKLGKEDRVIESDRLKICRIFC